MSLPLQSVHAEFLGFDILDYVPWIFMVAMR